MNKKEKTMHELAKEFPQKTYAELEKYRNEDRQQEANNIPLTDQQKEGEEQDNPTLWEIAKKHKVSYADAVPIQEDMRLKRDALKAACTLGEMRKDRTPLTKMKKRAEKAELEYSLIKGIDRNETKELEKKISDLLDKTDLIDDINRFHQKFGFQKNNKVGIPDDPELVNFRTSFLMEELSEYTNAIVKKDTAEVLDALVDIVYIALGTAWLFNLPFEKAWKEIQAANMKKIRARDKTGKRGTKFDVIKPKGFIEPNIERIIEEEREWNDEKNSNNRI